MEQINYKTQESIIDKTKIIKKTYINLCWDKNEDDNDDEIEETYKKKYEYKQRIYNDDTIKKMWQKICYWFNFKNKEIEYNYTPER